ncbi:MAG: TIGR00730 family Rossman fold protein, partial [Spirochaetaceae bacterium]
NLTSITVFCGSSTGVRPAYREAAAAFGRMLAGEGIDLVYGGGNVGLMGVLADAALGAGGRVVGVMPQRLVDLEIAHQGLTELHVVADMHERKAGMAARGDAFVALPGGPGTMEEFFEAWVWHRLGVHEKPVGLLNVDGYYDGLNSFLDRMTREGFMDDYYRGIVVVEPDPARLIARLRE